MTAATDERAALLLESLEQRLRVAADVLLDPGVVDRYDGHTTVQACMDLMPALLEACPRKPGPELWLALTAITASFPLAPEIERAARQLELYGADAVAAHALDQVFKEPWGGRPDLPMTLVRDGVVVDVDFCARNDQNTGIQRVVRAVMPRWVRDHDPVFVVDLDERSAYRNLAPMELHRVLKYGQPPSFDAAEERDYRQHIVVPWRSTVVCGEVPPPGALRRIAALGEYSGNDLALIAYDMIPILSVDQRPIDGESGSFGQYLGLVKRAHRIAPISSSARDEFAGFSDMLAAQGIRLPTVREVELPEDIGDVEVPARARPVDARPTVLITGRQEPHKNLVGPLHAVHRLWEEGLDFEVVMMGGLGWDSDRVEEMCRQIQEAGHPLTTLGWVEDDDMWRRIRNASFVVFTSLHEGYGLPIAEAMALGTPVITSNYGSQAEIGSKGGCLLVDPRNDREITDAIRLLLTDPDRLQQLRDEIGSRPTRRWDDYARELWSFLVDGKEPA